jgi:hypothetical protein
MTNQPRASLTVVGTGIAVGAQTTLEARLAIEQADRLLHLVADPVAEAWLGRRHSAGESLRDCYREGRPRRDSYAEMVARVLAALAAGGRVVWATYGHPGVFAGACHQALQAARAAGYPARMQAGVGADSCIWADLEVDPGQHGVQQWEATDWLLRRRGWDATSLLVLWQVGAIGQGGWSESGWDMRRGLGVLARRLLEQYPARHQACLYEAAVSPALRPRRDLVAIEDLAGAAVSTATTLVVFPLPPRPWDRSVADDVGLSDFGGERHYTG